MQIESYLFFDGDCEEALNFYARCLGGRVTALMRYQGSPLDNAELPAGWKQKIMHANFEAEGAKFMASDGLPGAGKQPHGGFSLSLYIPNDVEKARRLFDALAAGGKVQAPFAPPFWGGHFGMLKDRFGVPWMVSTE